MGEVFLLGHWKNYEELESNLSMPEILLTLKAMRDKEQNQRKFAASLKGISLGDDAENTGPSFDDVRRRALGINASSEDVLSLQGEFAQEAGFGIGMGLGYTKE